MAPSTLQFRLLEKGHLTFIEKHLDLNRVLIAARNSFQHKEIKVETKSLQKKMDSRQASIIGTSDSIQRVLKNIDTVVPTEARVIITGEPAQAKNKRLGEFMKAAAEQRAPSLK